MNEQIINDPRFEGLKNAEKKILLASPTMHGDEEKYVHDAEADKMIIESMILNGKNERVNRKLQEAATEIKHALSDLSDALFDATVS